LPVCNGKKKAIAFFPERFISSGISSCGQNISVEQAEVPKRVDNRPWCVRQCYDRFCSDSGTNLWLESMGGGFCNRPGTELPNEREEHSAYFLLDDVRWS
jgi:hypothetical protein